MKLYHRLRGCIRLTGDSSGEWYEDTACGTLVALGDQLYGPADIPAGGNATGAGTSASPYAVTTVVDLGTSGVRLTEKDGYVVGQESYRTDVSLSRTSGTGAITEIGAGQSVLVVHLQGLRHRQWTLGGEHGADPALPVRVEVGDEGPGLGQRRGLHGHRHVVWPVGSPTGGARRGRDAGPGEVPDLPERATAGPDRQGRAAPPGYVTVTPTSPATS